ncbi:MAG: hypothetical protein Q4G46_06870 [Propionibacteriaceae bacterium]|nr:hypothetical protein [Propionibacteriaceae bacterium]
MTTPRPHRPVVRDPGVLDALSEGHDPVAALHAAHETAAVLLHTGRAAEDPEVTARLVSLVDEIGLSTLAELWAERPAQSLPGALWRLYAVREWVVARPEEAARDYAAGIRFTEPNHVVAGVDPTGPEEIRRVADAILHGVFDGDFAIALERAAAFCHVVAAGRADIAREYAGVRSALRLQDAARDLVVCARMWRAGTLQ